MKCELCKFTSNLDLWNTSKIPCQIWIWSGSENQDHDLQRCDSLQYGRMVITSSRKSSTNLHCITIKETGFLIYLAWLGCNNEYDNRVCPQTVIYCLFTNRDILPVCKPWYIACLQTMVYRVRRNISPYAHIVEAQMTIVKKHVRHKPNYKSVEIMS